MKMNIQYCNTISEKDYNGLRKSVGWREISAKRAQTGLGNTAFQIVAEDDNIPVGMARVISDGGYIMYIADVVVHPEYQGYGIGKTMLNKIMEYIHGSMEDGETVFVCLMAAKGRESFYKQFGFKERPDEEFGAGMSQRIDFSL
jgi:N-acetylglutamate synthase-like GNAT family acetyltransferase